MNTKISNLNTLAEARVGMPDVKNASLELDSMTLIVGNDSRYPAKDIEIIQLNDRPDIFEVLVGDFLDAGAAVILDEVPRLFWASWA